MIAVARPALALAALLLCGLACKTKEDEFYTKVFPCTPNSTDQCGTARNGKPMKCFSAVSLGGSAFCAESCDPKVPGSAPAGTICTASGALLTECKPLPSAADGGADAGVEGTCPEGLSCYRTSLGENRGVCMALPTCSSNEECTTGTRRTCASSLIRSVLPSAVAAVSSTDHLHCVQSGCQTANMACPTGEACLGSAVYLSQAVNDACVPTCEDSTDCPPNFTCLHDPVTAPGGPRVCFPRMVGSRCSAAENCLAGQCTNVGVEFNVCAVPCALDAQCGILNTPTDIFVCAQGHCLTPRPFQGNYCTDDSGCPAGLHCFDESPFGPSTHKECRLPCDVGGKCPSRGGLPHICLGANHDGGCYPSSFGMPCSTQADCIADFKCMPAGRDSHSRTDYSPTICTIPCTVDADCDRDSWTKFRGYCSAEKICRLSGGLGTECDRDAMCEQDRCDEPAQICIAPTKP
jgi:hypothetical protein